MRKGATYILLTVIFTGIILLFWYNEWVYSLPTPVPDNYKQIDSGASINVSEQFKFNNNKPLLIHFFNPDCPCSRFNIPHFQSLSKEFGEDVNFAVVVMSDKKYSEKEICKKLAIDVPITTDTTVARICGVYSTPQAVIIDTNGKLYFRGNYNKSRYCTDKNSNYAQNALEALLGRTENIFFNRKKLRAYGCELPQCTKKGQ